MSLLTVKNLNVSFATKVVKNVSFTIEPGELVGIVGESGSGKSVTMQAVLGLLPENARWSAEKIHFSGQKRLGKDISMIFQDPIASLNPCFTIGNQLEEAIAVHAPEMSESQCRARAIELLQLVGLADAESQLKAYPHQLSGGMNQRAMIAISIAHHPKLLIADEPTTALDVTIQAQILDLLLRLNQQYQMGIILISHDLAVVSETCDRILVMKSGEIVETGTTADIIERPTHPYTKMLLDCCQTHHA